MLATTLKNENYLNQNIMSDNTVSLHRVLKASPEKFIGRLLRQTHLHPGYLPMAFFVQFMK